MPNRGKVKGWPRYYFCQTKWSFAILLWVISKRLRWALFDNFFCCAGCSCMKTILWANKVIFWTKVTKCSVIQMIVAGNVWKSVNHSSECFLTELWSYFWVQRPLSLRGLNTVESTVNNLVGQPSSSPISGPLGRATGEIISYLKNNYWGEELLLGKLQCFHMLVKDGHSHTESLSHYDLHKHLNFS